MRYLILAFSFTLFSFYSNSQKLTYSIVYGLGFKYNPPFENNAPYFPHSFRLLYNDMVSFYFMPLNLKDLTRNVVSGKRYFHHVFYRKPLENFFAQGSSYNLKKKIFILDTSNRKWILIPGNRTIAGYKCSSAISLGINNDTTFAYYTRELPQGFGPEDYAGLPGTVLEIYNPRDNKYILANKVTVGEFELRMPENIPTMSREEFQKRKAGHL